MVGKSVGVGHLKKSGNMKYVVEWMSLRNDILLIHIGIKTMLDETIICS